MREANHIWFHNQPPDVQEYINHLFMQYKNGSRAYLTAIEIERVFAKLQEKCTSKKEKKILKNSLIELMQKYNYLIKLEKEMKKRENEKEYNR